MRLRRRYQAFEDLDPAVAAVAKEIERIQFSAQKTARRSERLAAAWGAMHVLLGLPAAVLAAASGIVGLTDLASKHIAAYLALCAAVLTAAATFLSSSDRSERRGRRAIAFRAVEAQANLIITASIGVLRPAGATGALRKLQGMQQEARAGTLKTD